jgi:hypothetical protein
MAYYNFLKSLRSLEEFRKNPHIKIPPKSPPTNFQSLVIFKNPIFIPTQIFLQHSAQSAPAASRPTQPFGPFSPTGLLPPPATKQGAAAAAFQRHPELHTASHARYTSSPLHSME